ncbi:unnamed protein product [Medioppia subpectinata]|uniref:Rab3 GTPase-activating protein non-catalytic subunit n=1 Tax=Medioppia subpectinata TaxID=1979941 RepID=A0A7R9PTK3_9ACAR|nr:unnamed protein product [Medioppia subpectinata]CAG2100235.1 unnamed protein product [Medioppia subpectinata]
MTTTLNKFCVLTDLKALKQILVPDYQTIQERNRDDDYDNRWNWQTSHFLDKADEQSLAVDDSDWMQRLMASVVTFSPLSDLMAFAKQSHLAVYKLKSSDNASASDPNADCGRELQLSFETQLTAGQDLFEEITSLLLVPIVSQQKSSFAFNDWTAIIIGFSSGYLRIYTESGKLLLSQCLHDEPIIDIKCHTFRANSSSDSDQLLVIHTTTVVIVDGFSLYQTLRLCRNRLAKNQSTSGSDLSFNYKKWKLDESERIQDCCLCGPVSTTVYDSYVSHSVKGPYGQPPPLPTSADQLITCGENPFVGFYTAFEPTPAIINELTQAMVTKMKNIIPFGGLFGGNKGNDEKDPKSESATVLPLKLGLFDERRALSMTVSPNKRLAAVVDDYGRVTLIDVSARLAVRMWKGYRDAQVGWIEVQEEPNGGPATKRASFLVIYAPKRGILEIWCTQMGPRVGAFNVGKTCRLIHCQHSIMGLNALLIQQFKDVIDLEKSRCFLFDYSTGVVYNIEVPFLCALTDPNSKRTRDLHLFRELQNVLKTSGKSIAVDKVVELVLMLKTAEVRKDCLKELCATPDLRLIQITATKLREQLMISLERNELDFENKLIAQMCSRIIQLCRLYETIETKSPDNSYMSESLCSPDIQELMESLNWTGSDIARIISFLAFKDALITGRSTATTAADDANQTVATIADILSQFVLYSNHIVKSGDQEVYTDVPIELHIDVNVDKTQTKQLLALTWLSLESCNYWKCWLYFNNSLDVLMALTKEDKSETMIMTETCDDETDSLSNQWTDILEIICDSNNIMAALIAVHVIKAANGRETAQSKPLDNSADTEWETLHIANESLNLLIKQLEDLFLLDMLLHSNRAEDPEEDPSHEPNGPNISLSYMLGSGPGIVSELVAKWAINSNIMPDIINKLISEPSILSDSNQQTDPDVDDVVMGEEALEGHNLDIKTTTELIDHLRRRFPNSLESDVLLVNSCWELMVRWNKDPSIVDNSLTDALEYLNFVSSAVLKHNAACLMWKTYVLKRFECLSQLMEKMGRTPKDRICKKELGINENRIESFVNFAQQLFDLILNANMLAEMEPMPLFSVDDWWKPTASPAFAQHNINQSVPLVVLAVHQKIANGALVLEHSRLATIIQFIVIFQLKSSKPLSLFPIEVQQYLFKELHTFPVVSTNANISLTERRTKFLLNSVSAIVQTLPVHNETDSDSQYIVEQSKHYSEANKWFGKAVTLSREWELNVDEIRRKYVYELYFYGCDPLAEEAITAVVDGVSLGTELLTVAGMRVLNGINDKYGSVEQMHTLPTNVLFWLKSLKEETSCYTGSPMRATIALLQHISNYVYNDKQNARICDTLIETVRLLNYK